MKSFVTFVQVFSYLLVLFSGFLQYNSKSFKWSRTLLDKIQFYTDEKLEEETNNFFVEVVKSINFRNNELQDKKYLLKYTKKKMEFTNIFLKFKMLFQKGKI